MAGEYLLDSNVIIRQLRRRRRVRDILEEWSRGEPLHVSAVTRCEIIAGMPRHEEEQTLALLESLETIPVTARIADQAGRWIYQYARRGQQIPLPDALIAATAAVHALTLVTTNGRHFPMPEVHLYQLEL